MRVLLVGNPASGSGRGAERMRLAERELRAAGARVECVLTESVGHAYRLLRAPPADVDRVVACGGDGLVSEAAAALSGGDIPLAVVPGGRGNDFARALDVPLDLAAAARLAVSGSVRHVDLGLANDRPFCTIAACGVDADVSRRARAAWLPLPGPGVYVLELLRAIATYRAPHAVVEVDGLRLELDPCVVAVANSRTYGGGFVMAPQARLDDGLLDACLVRAASRARMLTLFPTIFAGRHAGLREVTMLRGEEITLTCDPPQPVEADGELLASTPVIYRCAPAALPVVGKPARS